MEVLFTLLYVLQALAVSLGVGASTLAAINFLYAISDGIIDETERNMMGIVYYVLRIAMSLIFLTTLSIGLLVYFTAGIEYLTPFFYALWTLIGALYVNALLMTFHQIPSTVGPAIQIATWHTLGILLTLSALSLTHFTYIQFFFPYVTSVALAVAVINGSMWYFKETKQSTN